MSPTSWGRTHHHHDLLDCLGLRSTAISKDPTHQTHPTSLTHSGAKSCDQPHEREHDHPHQNTATAKLIADRIRDLSHRKTKAEIASEAGFPNANMMTFLKNGRNKVPIDRVPSLAKALEVDPAYLMRLALDQAVGAKAAKAAKAIVDIFGTPATVNEQG